jgi:hypothetical protein
MFGQFASLMAFPYVGRKIALMLMLPIVCCMMMRANLNRSCAALAQLGPPTLAIE